MRLTPELARWQEVIEQHAKEYGLDGYETIFELLSYDELNEVASFGGFPTRYPHWRFGMQYEQLSKGYEFGLSKIYELVINNDPCYAYLMTSNPLVDQKLVMSHVYGHNDFFKNNAWFAPTNRKMMDEMANHATKVRRLVDRIGLEKVEEFIDTALSLENLIDRMSPYRGSTRSVPNKNEPASTDPHRLPSKDYMESFINPPEVMEQERARREQAEEEKQKQSMPRPERDILSYLIENAPLQSWQVEILEIVRSEAYYFSPQGMTKIMNEGWASYWHQKIMTKKVLQDDEVIDYADTMAGVISASGAALNPYQIGLALYHDIEERWNTGRHGLDFDNCSDLKTKAAWNTKANAGREKIFEVRRHHNDITFIDEFLTEDFCHRHKLFTYGWNPQTQQREITTRDFPAVKEGLLRQLTNAGDPVIEVVDANFNNRGELVLRHRFEDSELEAPFAKATLTNVQSIWNRPVLLETVIDDRPVRYRAEEGRIELENID
ncbi:MAG: SpoVR family protein [Planctomycetota bacterium]